MRHNLQRNSSRINASGANTTHPVNRPRARHERCCNRGKGRRGRGRRSWAGKVDCECVKHHVLQSRAESNSRMKRSMQTAPATIVSSPQEGGTYKKNDAVVTARRESIAQVIHFASFITFGVSMQLAQVMQPTQSTRFPPLI